VNFSVNKFLKDRRLWMISIIIFILLITVFDKNNLIEVWKLNQQLNELESQRDYYQQKITQDSTILENLKDDTFLERYAREHYLMKRQGETIYIIKE
jgi:septum formation initiator